MAACIFLAMWLDTLAKISKAQIVCVVGTVAILSGLLLNAFGMVFHIRVLETVDNTRENGSLGVDRGTKAAAWWIRNNTESSAVVFTDAFASITQTVGLYYFHRPIVSLEFSRETTVDTNFQMLANNLELIDIIVVGVEHLDRISPQAQQQFRMAANVAVAGQPSLIILVRQGGNTASEAPILLDTTEYNLKYDDMYTHLHEIVNLPLTEIQATSQKLR